MKASYVCDWRPLKGRKTITEAAKDCGWKRLLKNAMCVYTAELICSTGVLGFQTFKPVFCIYNKLRLHAEMLS